GRGLARFVFIFIGEAPPGGPADTTQSRHAVKFEGSGSGGEPAGSAPPARVGHLSPDDFIQYTGLRRELIGGRTRCDSIGELGSPVFCTAPITTVRSSPPMGTVASTGDGGRPPPTKVDERVPPQAPVTPIAPEALSRFRK